MTSQTVKESLLVPLCCRLCSNSQVSHAKALGEYKWDSSSVLQLWPEVHGQEITSGADISRSF